MITYEYKCTECGALTEREFRESTFVGRCPNPDHDATTLFKRHYTVFTYKPDCGEHFNHALGRGVRSMRHFNEELKRTSDEHAERLQQDIKYVPVDLNDREATHHSTRDPWTGKIVKHHPGEGIYESNVERSRRGEPLLKEPKGDV